MAYVPPAENYRKGPKPLAPYNGPRPPMMTTGPIGPRPGDKQYLPPAQGAPQFPRMGGDSIQYGPGVDLGRPPASGYQTAAPPVSGATPAAGTGTVPPAAPYSNQSQVQTNITPQSIYTPEMTQWAVNQAVADNTPDLRNAMKQFDRPGVSRGSGTMAAAMPAVAASQLAQREAAANIPFLDNMANQKHMMSGEIARENQALEMGNLLNRLNSTRQQEYLGGRQNDLSQLAQNSSLLQSLFGMMG